MILSISFIGVLLLTLGLFTSRKKHWIRFFFITNIILCLLLIGIILKELFVRASFSHINEDYILDEYESYASDYYRKQLTFFNEPKTVYYDFKRGSKLNYTYGAYTSGVIYISNRIYSKNKEQNTLLHEYAHYVFDKLKPDFYERSSSKDKERYTDLLSYKLSEECLYTSFHGNYVPKSVYFFFYTEKKRDIDSFFDVDLLCNLN